VQQYLRQLLRGVLSAGRAFGFAADDSKLTRGQFAGAERFRRPSPALVVALVALFFALAGSGYAVSRLPRNSVTSAQVKDYSLLKRDFRRGQLPRGPRGPQGIPGLLGMPGAKGDKGDRGPSDGWERWFCSTDFDPNVCGLPSINIVWTDYASAPNLVTLDNLPAGDYLFTIELTILGQLTSYWRVSCEVFVPRVAAGAGTTSVGDIPGYARYATFPIAFGADNVPEGSSADLRCIRGSGTGANPSLILAEITAIKVGNLTTSGVG
jgi:hypothetical protein